MKVPLGSKRSRLRLWPNALGQVLAERLSEKRRGGPAIRDPKRIYRTMANPTEMVRFNVNDFDTSRAMP